MNEDCDRAISDFVLSMARLCLSRLMNKLFDKKLLVLKQRMIQHRPMTQCAVSTQRSMCPVTWSTTRNCMHKMWTFTIWNCIFNIKIQGAWFHIHLDRRVLMTVKIRPMKSKWFTSQNFQVILLSKLRLSHGFSMWPCVKGLAKAINMKKVISKMIFNSFLYTRQRRAMKWK